MVGLELCEIMGLAVAVDDLHIADASLDPLPGKLDRIGWAVRLRPKACTVRGEPSYEVPRRLLHSAKHIGSLAARYRGSSPLPHSKLRHYLLFRSVRVADPLTGSHGGLPGHRRVTWSL